MNQIPQQKKLLFWRLLFALFVVAAACGPTFTQDQPPPNAYPVTTRYDRFTDTTTVMCELLEWSRERVRLTVQAKASFQGKEPKESISFYLSLSFHQSGATRQTQPLFAKATSLLLTPDTGQMQAAIKDYHQDYFESVHLYAESARVAIGPEDLPKLLTTQQLAGQWGGESFPFSASALAALKTFISRHVIVAADR